jgi:hypothetical protein
LFILKKELNILVFLIEIDSKASVIDLDDGINILGIIIEKSEDDEKFDI